MVVKIQDRWNDKKIWVITKTECRHLYMQQEISGRLTGRKVRTTHQHLVDIGVLVEGDLRVRKVKYIAQCQVCGKHRMERSFLTSNGIKSLSYNGYLYQLCEGCKDKATENNLSHDRKMFNHGDKE